MQFTVEHSDLLGAVIAAGACVGARTAIPILASVNVVASDDGLTLSGTDLEMGVIVPSPARVMKAGALCLPVKLLRRFLEALPVGPITVAVAGCEATLESNGFRFNITGTASDSFPALPEAPASCATFSASDFAKAAKRVLISISEEESRFTLNGALMEFGGAGLRMVSTDSHRMTLVDIGTLPEAPARAMIPRGSLRGLLRMLESVPGDAQLHFGCTDTHLFFQTGDRLLISRKFTGNFPDYARLMPAPSDFKWTVAVDRAALAALLKAAASSADERSRRVRFNFELSKFICRAETLGSTFDGSVGAVTTGEPEEVAFNADYFLEFLDVCGAEEIRMRFRSHKQTSQIETAESGDGYKYLVMPMRR